MTDELLSDKVQRVPMAPRCVHSLGAVKKPNGKLRPITDCSQPPDININEHMTTTCSKFHYKTLDTVVHMMHESDFGAVSDIASTYRAMHIIPSHRCFQGFRWDLGRGPEFFEDLRLCFGGHCSPYAFIKFSDFVVKCINKMGVSRSVNYLDDFVVLGASEAECASNQELLHNMLFNFGFEVKSEKVTAPSQVCKYLCIVVNTIDMTLSIDDDKLLRVKNGVLDLLDKSTCPRKSLEEVAGLLAHCATVVKGGCSFARRIYNLLRDATCETVTLDECVKQDLIWWASFTQWFNGKACVLGGSYSPRIMCSDASNFGFGAYTDKDYFWGCWFKGPADCPHSESAPRSGPYSSHINVTELWPVVVAIHRWGSTGGTRMCWCTQITHRSSQQ